MRYFRKSILWLSVILLLILGLVYSMQEKLIFLPTKLETNYTYQFEHPFEELFVTTDDGATLNALHFKVEAPKGAILYFHGNAGDLSRRGSIVSYFLQYDYEVLVMDYRNYGKSTGSISEQALYQDAIQFYDLLNEQYTEDEIIVYGRSLGTTFATYVASQNNPQQLILETPFYNLTHVAKQRFPILPIKFLLRYSFPTNRFMTNVSCPVTIIHGTDDSVVAYNSGKKLAEEIPETHRNFVTVPGADHNNLIDFEAYHKAISKLLK